MIQFKDHELCVTGKIDYNNAEQYYQAGLKEIVQCNQYPLVLNLAELEQGSTLALAVLVRWLRQAPDAQSLHFKAVPEKMLKIIQACHLEHDLKLI